MADLSSIAFVIVAFVLLVIVGCSCSNNLY
ncbi:sporulation protein YjcZ [Bacillus carboniphilus]|uniref:Sporulation protein YjcZ n=1 Tax=Bacillus carboniphilus TaxID=86663 RepID=A0ABY9JSY3_9BACI|nr:sporulation protein YjcZ [Bacillus carboniphilus]WLR42504.1 sporulation protein YjcZ [Bacillus carboniphilus]